MNRILSTFREAGRAAFSTREFASLLGNRGYARLVLHRLKKRGRLVLVKRGWWAFPDALPAAVACVISAPCYVSFHSALHLRGLTTQVPKSVQLAVARNASYYEVLGARVREYRVKKTSFNNFFARDGLLVATPEKAFADCLNVPRACPEIVLREAGAVVDLNAVAVLVSRQGFKRLRRLRE